MTFDLDSHSPSCAPTIEPPGWTSSCSWSRSSCTVPLSSCRRAEQCRSSPDLAPANLHSQTNASHQHFAVAADDITCLQVLHNTFFWISDTHPHPRNANNVEHYTSVTLFPRNFTTHHPALHYVTLEWPFMYNSAWTHENICKNAGSCFHQSLMLKSEVAFFRQACKSIKTC